MACPSQDGEPSQDGHANIVNMSILRWLLLAYGTYCALRAVSALTVHAGVDTVRVAVMCGECFPSTQTAVLTAQSAPFAHSLFSHVARGNHRLQRAAR